MNDTPGSDHRFIGTVNLLCNIVGFGIGIWCAAMAVTSWEISEHPAMNWVVAPLVAIVGYGLGRVLSFPLMVPLAAILDGVFISGAIADIQDRRKGLIPAEDKAAKMLTMKGWLPEYTAFAAWAENWPAWIRRDRLSNALAWVSTIGGLLTLAGGSVWLVCIFTQESEWLGAVVAKYTFLVSGITYVIAALGLKVLPQIHLGYEVARHLVQLVLPAPGHKLVKDDSYTVILPLGTPAQLTVRGERLVIDSEFPALPASIQLVDRGVLPLEDEDIDVGESLFDRATIVMPNIDGSAGACPSAWMPHEIRTLSLALLNHGNRIDRGFVASFDLGTNDAMIHIARLLPFVDAMGHVCRQLGQMSISDRVGHALRSAIADQHRELIISEVKLLPSAKIRHDIGLNWLREGEGVSRALAIETIDFESAPDAALELIRDEGEGPDIRSRALIHWLRQDGRGGTEILVELIDSAKGDDQGVTALIRTAAPAIANTKFEEDVQTHILSRLATIQIPACLRAHIALIVSTWPLEGQSAVNIERVRMWIESASQEPDSSTLAALNLIIEGTGHHTLAQTARTVAKDLSAELERRPTDG